MFVIIDALIFFQTFYDMNDNPAYFTTKWTFVHANLIQYTIAYNGMDYHNIEFVPYEV